MKYCPYCFQQARDNDRFCKVCGKTFDSKPITKAANSVKDLDEWNVSMSEVPSKKPAQQQTYKEAKKAEADSKAAPKAQKPAPKMTTGSEVKKTAPAAHEKHEKSSRAYQNSSIQKFDSNRYRDQSIVAKRGGIKVLTAILFLVVIAFIYSLVTLPNSEAKYQGKKLVKEYVYEHSKLGDKEGFTVDVYSSRLLSKEEALEVLTDKGLDKDSYTHVVEHSVDILITEGATKRPDGNLYYTAKHNGEYVVLE